MPVGHQALVAQRPDVHRQHADAMGIVAGQVGLDQLVGDQLGLARRAAARGADRAGQRVQGIMAEHRHPESPVAHAAAPAARTPADAAPSRIGNLDQRPRQDQFSGQACATRGGGPVPLGAARDARERSARGRRSASGRPTMAAAIACAGDQLRHPRSATARAQKPLTRADRRGRRCASASGRCSILCSAVKK